MRRLIRDSSALGAGLLTAQLVTAVTYWIVARSLDPAGLGLLMGAVGIGRFLTIVADFGMNSAAVRALAQQPALSSSFTTTLATKLLLAVSLGTGWIVLACIGGMAGLWPWTISLLGPFLAFEIVASTLEVPLRAAQRMVVVSGLTTADAVLGLVSVGGLVLSGRDPALALPVGLTVASGSTAVWSWWLIEPRFRKLTRIGLRRLATTWKESLHFGLVGLATQIQRADVAVVGALAGPTAAGIFAIPARLVGPLSIIPYAYSAALFPRVAAAQDHRRAHREAVGSALLLLIGMSVLLGALFVFAHPAVETILGHRYLQSARVLRVYLVGVLVAALNQPMAIFLQAEGQERFVACIVAPASLAGMAGIAVGAAADGAFGAAFGFVLLHTIVAAFLVTRSALTLRESIGLRFRPRSTKRHRAAEGTVRSG